MGGGGGQLGDCQRATVGRLPGLGLRTIAKTLGPAPPEPDNGCCHADSGPRCRATPSVCRERPGRRSGHRPLRPRLRARGRRRAHRRQRRAHPARRAGEFPRLAGRGPCRAALRAVRKLPVRRRSRRPRVRRSAGRKGPRRACGSAWSTTGWGRCSGDGSGRHCARRAREVLGFNPPRIDSPFAWLTRDHRKSIVDRWRDRLRGRIVHVR